MAGFLCTLLQGEGVLVLPKRRDITAVDKRGRTALHLAARSGRWKELIKFLIRHGSDVHVRYFSGRTVLGVADERGMWKWK